MGEEPLTERIRDDNSREPNQTLPNQYSIKEIAKDVTLRTVLVIGSVAAIYGAVEIARYYHFVDYVRRFF